MNVVLIGMPGCGKSTAGRQLSRLWQWPFIDSDHEIERQCGCSVREYFDRAGEPAFRDVEQQTIERLMLLRGHVIATGGGAVVRAANRAAIGQDGNWVIYLRARPEELARRLRRDTHRPLLHQGVDPLKRLRELFQARDPLYRELARFVIDTGRTSVPTLVNLVAMQLDLAGFDPSLGRDHTPAH